MIDLKLLGKTPMPSANHSKAAVKTLRWSTPYWPPIPPPGRDLDGGLAAR